MRLLKIRGAVGKTAPKESKDGDHTALRGSVRAPKGFSEGKPEGAQRPRVCLRKFQREPSHWPAAQCRHPRNSPEGRFFFHTAPRIFNSCLVYQNHEVYLPADCFYPPADWLYPSADWLYSPDDRLYPPADWLYLLVHVEIKVL